MTGFAQARNVLTLVLIFLEGALAGAVWTVYLN
jgi:hypothetical protein